LHRFRAPARIALNLAALRRASLENKGLAFAAVTSRTTFAAPMAGIANHDWIAVA